MRERSTRVMSFNIQTAAARAPALPWSDRRDAVVAVIGRAAPDIAGLQEVVPGQLAFVAARLPRYTVVAGEVDNDLTRQHNPILVDAERYTVEDSGSFWMSETPAVAGSRGWDGMFGRVTTWARLLDRTCDCEVLVVNTHLDHRGTAARVEGAALLAREVHARAAAAADLAVVVTGDFNAEPGSEVHTRMLAGSSGLRDAYAVAEPTGAAATLVDGRRIDWILVSPHWEVRAAGTVDEEPGRASDHHALTADLRRP